MMALCNLLAKPNRRSRNQDGIAFHQLYSLATLLEVVVSQSLGSSVELALVECAAYFTLHCRLEPVFDDF